MTKLKSAALSVTLAILVVAGLAYSQQGPPPIGPKPSAGGSGDALTSNPLSQFAATTSAQLAGVLSNETGTGLAVFGTSPNITAPTGIVKGDIGLGNVDNTSDTTKNAASVNITNHNLDRTNLINNYPAAPQTDTTDTWLATNAACIAAARCPFVSHVTFPAAATSGTVDGTHTGVTVKWLFSLTGSGGPTLTYSLVACPAANFTAGTAATVLPVCSSGLVSLWSSTAATITTAAVNTGYGIEVWATAGGTAGTFIVSKIMGGNSAGASATSAATVACGATCTGGSWVIYPGITYSAATAGNTITTTGFYVPYI